MTRLAQRLSLLLRQTLRLGAVALTLMALAPDASAFTFTTIDYPGATQTEAWGINTAGQIVGVYRNGGDWRGFLRHLDGTFTPIDVPGHEPPQTEAYGICGKKVVGTYYDKNNILRGFLATP